MYSIFLEKDIQRYSTTVAVLLIQLNSIIDISSLLEVYIIFMMLFIGDYKEISSLHQEETILNRYYLLYRV